MTPDTLTPDEIAAATGKRAEFDLAASSVLPAIYLRDMRKYAAQLAPDLASASKLLQHSILTVTQQHYRQGDKITPVR